MDQRSPGCQFVSFRFLVELEGPLGDEHRSMLGNADDQPDADEEIYSRLKPILNGGEKDAINDIFNFYKKSMEERIKALQPCLDGKPFPIGKRKRKKPIFLAAFLRLCFKFNQLPTEKKLLSYLPSSDSHNPSHEAKCKAAIKQMGLALPKS